MMKISELRHKFLTDSLPAIEELAGWKVARTLTGDGKKSLDMDTPLTKGWNKHQFKDGQSFYYNLPDMGSVYIAQHLTKRERAEKPDALMKHEPGRVGCVVGVFPQIANNAQRIAKTRFPFNDDKARSYGPHSPEYKNELAKEDAFMRDDLPKADTSQIRNKGDNELQL